MRLIDADELIKHACRSTEWSHGEHPMVVEVDDIDDAPTVDAEPVKRAHWVDQKHGVYKCSNCGNFLDFSGVNAGRGDANYCPHCGAKMSEDHVL